MWKSSEELQLLCSLNLMVTNYEFYSNWWKKSLLTNIDFPLGLYWSMNEQSLDIMLLPKKQKKVPNLAVHNEPDIKL